MEQVHVGADGLAVMACPECGDKRGFEQPPCEEGHGRDCPDRACVECGTAISINPYRTLGVSAAHPDLIYAADQDAGTPVDGGGASDEQGSPAAAKRTGDVTDREAIWREWHGGAKDLGALTAGRRHVA